MRLISVIASITSVLAAALIGMVFPAAVEAGLFPAPAAFLLACGLLCLLAFGLSLISHPED